MCELNCHNFNVIIYYYCNFQAMDNFLFDPFFDAKIKKPKKKIQSVNAFNVICVNLIISVK